MPMQLLVPGLFVLLAVLTVLTNPLTTLGNSYGPGWADILNGGLGLVFLILAGVLGLILRRKAR